jgi:Zn-dependent oligopeptidase
LAQLIHVNRQVIGAADLLLTELERKIQVGDEVNAADLISAVQDITDPVDRSWGMVGHLKSVRDSAALRQAVENVLPGLFPKLCPTL